MPVSRTVRTVCPRNCYCTCGMLVTIDERDRILSIDGDAENVAVGVGGGGRGGGVVPVFHW